MITHGNEIKLFCGNSNRPLAEAIAKKLNTELGGIEVDTSADVPRTSSRVRRVVTSAEVLTLRFWSPLYRGSRAKALWVVIMRTGTSSILQRPPMTLGMVVAFL